MTKGFAQDWLAWKDQKKSKTKPLFVGGNFVGNDGASSSQPEWRQLPLLIGLVLTTGQGRSTGCRTCSLADSVRRVGVSEGLSQLMGPFCVAGVLK
jgi:hypothetical protein